MSPPYPTGTVLGAVENGFDFYVVPADGLVLPTPHPDWSVVKGVTAVPLLVQAPEDVSSGTVHYTIGMPGFLLQRGSVDLDRGYAKLVYDPIKLSRPFPNIDTRASRIDKGRGASRGLVDTVWVNVMLEADDGKFYARQFTLQGPDLYALAE